MRIFGASLLSIAGCVMIWQLYTISVAGMHRVSSGLLLIAMVCGPLVLGTYLLARSFALAETRRRVVKTVLLVLFGFYCIALLDALIFARIDFLHFKENAVRYRENFELMTNFNPLETVRLYLCALKYNYIGTEIPLANLIGNMMLFMPMAVFLPSLFAPMRKIWLFALVMLLLLVSIEALQLLLSCGSCDVDDVLLNLIGTLFVYGIMKIPAIHRLLVWLMIMPESTAAAKVSIAEPTLAETPEAQTAEEQEASSKAE